MDQAAFSQNRARAYELIKALGGIVIMKGYEAVSRPGTDYEYPFRQEGFFYYLTGANEADAWLAWDLESNEFHLFLTILPGFFVYFLLFNLEEYKVWMTVENLEDKKKYYSAENVHNISDLPTVVAQFISKGRNLIHTLQITSAEDVRKEAKLDEFIPIDRTNLQYYLGESRTIKTPGEIIALRKACDIATRFLFDYSY
jgi:Xaa-Pro dipeptidase